MMCWRRDKQCIAKDIGLKKIKIQKNTKKYKKKIQKREGGGGVGEECNDRIMHTQCAYPQVVLCVVEEQPYFAVRVRKEHPLQIDYIGMLQLSEELTGNRKKMISICVTTLYFLFLKTS